MFICFIFLISENIKDYILFWMIIIIKVLINSISFQTKLIRLLIIILIFSLILIFNSFATFETLN